MPELQMPKEIEIIFFTYILKHVSTCSAQFKTLWNQRKSSYALTQGISFLAPAMSSSVIFFRRRNTTLTSNMLDFLLIQYHTRF